MNICAFVCVLIKCSNFILFFNNQKLRQLRGLLVYIPWRMVIQEPIVAQLIAKFPNLEVENSKPDPIMKLVKRPTHSVIYILILSC